MLPSMPLLFSLSQDFVISDANEHLANSDIQETDNLGPKDVAAKVDYSLYQGEPDYNEFVLPLENTLFGDKRKAFSQPSNVRKKRKMEVIQPIVDDKNTDEEQANHFASAFFMKAKSDLDIHTFHQLMTQLSSISEENFDLISLYKSVSELLSGNEDLAQHFIGFLNKDQAKEIGKLHELLSLKQRWNFFRRLDAFHLNKLCHLLEQLLSNPPIDVETVRSSLNSSFKGHPSITEGILGLLPDGKPPSFAHESFDDISHLSDDFNSWETLSIQDTSSSCFPGECQCVCHLHTSKKFCTLCNIKYSKGQVYVQTGKVLRFAKVSFECSDPGKILRKLNPAYYNKPSSLERKRTRSQCLRELKNGLDSNPKSDAGALSSLKDGEDEGKIIKFLDKDDTDITDMSVCIDDKNKLEGEELNKNIFKMDPEFIVFEDNEDSSNSDIVDDTGFDSGNDLGACISPIPDEEDNLVTDCDLVAEKKEFLLEGVEISSEIVTNEIKSENDSNSGHIIKSKEFVSISTGENCDTDCPSEPVKEEPTENLIGVSDCDLPKQLTSEKCSIIVDDIVDKPCTGSNLKTDIGVWCTVGSEEEVDIRLAEEKVDISPAEGEVDIRPAEEEPTVDVKVDDPQDVDSKGATEGLSTETSSAKETGTPEAAEEKVEQEIQSVDPSTWTREEDKLILEAFRKQLGPQLTLTQICQQLPARSLDDVQKRFQLLMSLLEKMTKADYDN